jgi:hypothetical protein
MFDQCNEWKIIFVWFKVVLYHYSPHDIKSLLGTLNQGNNNKISVFRWQLDLIVDKTSMFPTTSPSSNNVGTNGLAEWDPAPLVQSQPYPQQFGGGQ